MDIETEAHELEELSGGYLGELGLRLARLPAGRRREATDFAKGFSPGRRLWALEVLRRLLQAGVDNPFQRAECEVKEESVELAAAIFVEPILHLAAATWTGVTLDPSSGPVDGAGKLPTDGLYDRASIALARLRDAGADDVDIASVAQAFTVQGLTSLLARLHNRFWDRHDAEMPAIDLMSGGKQVSVKDMLILLVGSTSAPPTTNLSHIRRHARTSCVERLSQDDEIDF